jgi:hypothetical protein
MLVPIPLATHCCFGTRVWSGPPCRTKVVPDCTRNAHPLEHAYFELLPQSSGISISPWLAIAFLQPPGILVVANSAQGSTFIAIKTPQLNFRFMLPPPPSPHPTHGNMYLHLLLLLLVPAGSFHSSFGVQPSSCTSPAGLCCNLALLTGLIDQEREAAFFGA